MTSATNFFEHLAAAVQSLSNPLLLAQLRAAAELLSTQRCTWTTGVGKSARAASLFAEDLATLTDGGRTHELVQASALLRTCPRVLLTSAAAPAIEADLVVRYPGQPGLPYGLPSATPMQVALARYLALRAAEHARVSHRRVRLAHPA